MRYGWNYALLLSKGPSKEALVPSPLMALVARAARFVAHERGSRRAPCPNHDHRARLTQFALDNGGIVLPRRERAIPPNIEAFRDQRLGNRPHAIAVFAGV